MTIYVIPNGISLTDDYVSSDEADVTTNATNPLIHSIVLGDISTADTILAKNQAVYLANQSYRISVNTLVIDGNSTIVTGVNYSTEQHNDSKVYNVFNDLTGTYTTVIGTTAMLTLVGTYQQQLLALANLTTVAEVTTIPQPKPPQPIHPVTTGTQSL